MASVNFMTVHNCEAADFEKIPVHDVAVFREIVIDRVVSGGLRISALFGMPSENPSEKLLCAVLAEDDKSRLNVLAAKVSRSYESITKDCPQAHWFEREIAEQWAVVPEGHPFLKPIRFHKSRVPGADAWNRKPGEIIPGDTNFFRVEGDEIHEVAVGPVHAGIIEPGHFRFQCHGEKVFNLEISLGYQHRGVENALIGAPDLKKLLLAETLCGDSSIAHSCAYCQGLEALADCNIPARAEAVRGVALELERVANHVGDLGALAGDVAFLPTASFCGRIRGDYLNMTADICGNRFGRGLVRPGGVNFDLDSAACAAMSQKLDVVYKDTEGSAVLLLESPSVLSRFEDTGVLRSSVAESLGLVGVAARASGSKRDVRFDFPYGIYRFSFLPVSSYHTGDVFARAYVRWLDVQHSKSFISESLRAFPSGGHAVECPRPRPGKFVVSMVEGWRGEICHVLFSDKKGGLAFCKVVDPSFHNWQGLAAALRDEEISNFPLCNKSFNLSYCGHDL